MSKGYEKMMYELKELIKERATEHGRYKHDKDVLVLEIRRTYIDVYLMLIKDTEEIKYRKTHGGLSSVDELTNKDIQIIIKIIKTYGEEI